MNTKSRKVAIVTGAAQGLGLAIADKLLTDDMNVVFIDNNDAQLNELRKSKILKDVTEDRFMLLNIDVSDVEAIQQGVEKTMGAWGRIDVLVNNAGVRKETALEDVTADEWNAILSINLGGTFFFSQAVLEIMKKQKQGRIINMSSFGGQAGPLTSGAHYCASKAGQLALTKVFARSLSDYGITVNAVSPAAIETPEMEKMDPDKLENMKTGIPVKRFGKAEEVADMVSYLASDSASYVTGATLDINGGLLMR
ncbi:3-oxoacyl-[acyl-carrier protein] reductase [Alteribacillus persepolensis]|uniref:3-oxoacyl-[acyl-carrier protein] reductase n=1 Tax=Alteribacillus persepolensis TaxID=568899 RepID=A0A1G8KL21_9BACI|nr:SDR family NAD(P)-dependent oxidoreductase [Alteribacillus persepolensis]SDI44105.1 3-oxoacyl-[acyl-carrier protein] reductase [Alteribacillus persepolensis]